MATADTREQLIAGTLATIRERGVAGVSARSVGARAGVNQALVFYHFGSVDNLLAESCRSETAAFVARYRARFDAVTSLRELLAVGRDVHADGRAGGQVTVLAQLLAAAQANPTLRAATAECLRSWTGQVEHVLRRVLAGGPLAGLFEPAALAHAVSAAFVGLTLVESVDPDATGSALAELDRLGLVAEVLDGLGPIARRAVRAKLAARNG